MHGSEYIYIYDLVYNVWNWLDSAIIKIPWRAGFIQSINIKTFIVGMLLLTLLGLIIRFVTE